MMERLLERIVPSDAGGIVAQLKVVFGVCFHLSKDD